MRFIHSLILCLSCTHTHAKDGDCIDLAVVPGYTDQLLLGRFEAVLDRFLLAFQENFQQDLPTVLQRP